MVVMTLNMIINTMMIKMKVIPARLSLKVILSRRSKTLYTSTHIFKKLSNKFRQSEQVDVDVHPDLVNLVTNSFRNGLSNESLYEIVKQIHRPENCVKTLANQGIWRLLKSFTQSEDSRLTAIQGVLLKASMNLVKLVKKLSLSNSELVE